MALDKDWISAKGGFEEVSEGWGISKNDPIEKVIVKREGSAIISKEGHGGVAPALGGIGL